MTLRRCGPLNDRVYKEERRMHYMPTRGHPERRKFCEILLEGLAPDGGVYVPETYPRVDDAMLDRWRRLSYPDLAFEILSLYIDDIPPADLKAICAKTYTPEVFGTAKIAPVRALETFPIPEVFPLRAAVCGCARTGPRSSVVRLFVPVQPHHRGGDFSVRS
ncbi:hypothetical protein LB566_26265 [Mesorhizobium sp. CA13]|uniref:hypothetical protein n=1 Tax=Mesorhizobium sp. CA13 TaxID=2876643 RepID=UPI001CC9DC36|nr:hypothetical protein [Mesorhizobium sp. CA13]MBZ9857305.1 hypothetical protein [Mesorhizobium sp. CA13]